MADKPMLAFYLVLLATLSGGCGDSGKQSAAPSGNLCGAIAGCNVLLITMDTTRADRLGCYGYQRAVTPALDALARRGVRFEQAFSQAPITLPSHATLLTGTYPPEHGVRDNWRHALGPGLPTLAETFRQHGYQTAGFIAATVLDARYGLARGFDAYDADMTTHEIAANEVTAKALAWLERAEARPFFCWVHFFDPHAPYAPPQRYLAKTGDAYDAEIAFMDTHVGRLIGWLRTNALLSNTLIVAVGDHGESLGEHRYSWHALLVYDGIMRVPLIFSLPEHLPENLTHAGVARIVDVMPTILDLLGWEIPAQVSGVSLIDALRGADLPARQAYGETDFPYESFGWSKLRSLVDERWKYIRAPRAELYDRGSDPGELRNVAQDHPDVVMRMEKELSAIEQRMQKRAGVPLDVDADTMQALRSLGYVAGPSPAATGDADLKNPIDMLDIAESFRIAESLLKAQRPRRTIELMEPAAQRSPESFVIIELLGKAYAAAGMLEIAHTLLLEALAIHADSPRTWFALARVCQARGLPARALQACNQVLELHPDHERTKQLLPELRRALQQQETRITELREQFQAEPDAAEVCLSLAQLLTHAGRAAKALDVLREGLTGNPENASLANNLAWQLATAPEDDLRDGAAALRWARIACRGEFESDPVVLDTLAAALAEVGEFDQAVETAQRAADLAAEDADQRDLRTVILRRLKSYKTKRPYRAPR